MVRFLNVAAIVALIGSAIYAYSIKYQTIFRAEEIVQLRERIKSEQDSIATLRAEWEHVSRPERIEALADRFLDLQQPSLHQIVPIEALPNKNAPTDATASQPNAPSQPIVASPGTPDLFDPTATPRNPHAAGEATN